MEYGRLRLTQLTDAGAMSPPSESWPPITECGEWDGLVHLDATDGDRQIHLTFAVAPPTHGEFTIAEKNNVLVRGTLALIDRPEPPKDSGSPILYGFIAGHYVLQCSCEPAPGYRIDLIIYDWTSID